MSRVTIARPLLPTTDTRTVSPPPKKADPFYLSPDWRSLIAEIIKERGRRCQKCGRTDCRLFGDHTVELRDGGPKLDKRNVVVLCGSCHTRKTLEARGKRMGESPSSC